MPSVPLVTPPFPFHGKHTLAGIPPPGVYSGTWGYNPCLVGIAIGGVFFVPHGPRFALVWLAAVVTSVVVHGAVSSGLAPVGLPPLCLPASITCIAFCLLAGAARDVVAVSLAAITVPVGGRELSLYVSICVEVVVVVVAIGMAAVAGQPSDSLAGCHLHCWQEDHRRRLRVSKVVSLRLQGVAGALHDVGTHISKVR